MMYSKRRGSDVVLRIPIAQFPCLKLLIRILDVKCAKWDLIIVETSTLISF